MNWITEQKILCPAKKVVGGLRLKGYHMPLHFVVSKLLFCACFLLMREDLELIDQRVSDTKKVLCIMQCWKLCYAYTDVYMIMRERNTKRDIGLVAELSLI